MKFAVLQALFPAILSAWKVLPRIWFGLHDTNHTRAALAEYCRELDPTEFLANRGPCHF